MTLLPAIDLVAGQVVRLQRGDRSRMDIYSTDPVDVAEGFRQAGARWIHVVNLSAAFGEDEDACAKNFAAIKRICAIEGVSVDLGGGIHSLDDVKRMVDLGAARIAMGTVLVHNPDLAAEAVASYGSVLVADVAGDKGEVRISGWRDDASLTVDELVARLVGLGFQHLVYTDIARDGMQTGIDPATYKHIAAVAGFPVIASGGIATLQDIRALATLGPHVIEGVIVGRALYEHAFTLQDALSAVGSAR
jgi:phosphoribosylformimino-5-aminoimidazole carboxamide ribotide isomerase